MENTADLFFVGLSMGFGVEILNQRSTFFEPTAQCFYEYEERTDRRVDLPPGIALALGLGRIGYSMITNEPACKERFDSMAGTVRKNAGAFIKKKFSVIGQKIPEIQEAETDD